MTLSFNENIDVSDIIILYTTMYIANAVNKCVSIYHVYK